MKFLHHLANTIYHWVQIMKNSSDIIIRSLLTEKMSRLEESERKYAFQVTN